MVVKDTEEEAAVDEVAVADVDVVVDGINNPTKFNKISILIRSFNRTNNNNNNRVFQEPTIATAGLTMHVGIPPIFAMLQLKDIATTPRLKTKWRGIHKISQLDGVG